jgi:subtilisin-like proprotein convertase family protein
MQRMFLAGGAKISSRQLFRLKTVVQYFIGVCLISINSVSAQPVSPDKAAWSHLPEIPPSKATAERWIEPEHGQFFRMDESALRANLRRVRPAGAGMAKDMGTEIELPMPDGTKARFAIGEASIMAAELAAKFPEIRTYAGQGIDDPGATVRLDLSPLGFHAQVLSPRGAVYVDPAFRGDVEFYVSYYKRDYHKAADDFQCFTAGRGTTNSGGGGIATGITAAKTLSGTLLRTYRLAVAATGEYTFYFGGSVSNGMAAIVAAVNRVNGIYETELAVRLVLVGNNDQLVYTDPETDPYFNDDPYALLNQNQSNLDAMLGDSNYDIGHVFSTAGGGLAGLGVVCVSGEKAEGETGSPAPAGDPFYVDFVAHEIGHQFGADHTFNGITGSCDGNRVGASAYEPGSGSTIMAYAGICSPNNLQPHSDPYFHAGSLDQIQTYISTGGGGACPLNTATTNGVPAVSAGDDYSIPQSTPFLLTAVGSDPDNDLLTYCWEELDLGPADALTSADNGSSPLFRSLLPVIDPVRYFPNFSSVLANTNWNQEKLPIASRTMNFRVTVRDNRSGGGGVADDDTQITVVSTAGPFVVTAPNTAVLWSGSKTVTWNVADSASSPINATAVNIRLSADGGKTFPYLLATNVSNNGSHLVTLPNINTTQARIKVEAAGNIFYDVSNVDFTVLIPNTASIQVAGTTLTTESCSPANGIIDPFETVTVNWALRNIGTAPTTNLIVTLLATNGVFSPSEPQAYGVIPVGGTVNRAFSFVPSGACGGSVTGRVQLGDGTVDLGQLTQTFALGNLQSSSVTQVVANASAISIFDSSVGSPYPSSILVSGVTGAVTKVTATLSGFTHTYPEDVGVLLVGPGGQTVMLMDGCGDGSDASGLSFTFDDSAAGSLPGAGFLTSGTYRPTAYFPDVFDSPAPPSPYGNTLAALGGAPNGIWSLYVQDFSAGDAGSLSGGWSLKLVLSNSVLTCCTTFPVPGFTSTSYSNNLVQFAWSAIPGPHYQVQYRTNLVLGDWQNLGSPLLATDTFMSVADAVTNGPMRFYRVVAQP